jgi:hypothetical protein
MVTVVNSPAGTDDAAGAGGWAVATVAIILIVLFALFLWPRLSSRAPAANDGGANINVTLPNSGGTNGGATGGTSGGTSGGEAGGSMGGSAGATQ